MDFIYRVNYPSTKVSGIPNRERTVSPTNGVRKTVCPHVTEMRPVSYIIHKNQLKMD